MDIYKFLKENDFGNTLETFKQELDTKPGMPLKSWALEPVKTNQVNVNMLTRSDKKISNLNTEGLRFQQPSTGSNLMKNIFGKAPIVDMPNQANVLMACDKRVINGSSRYIDQVELTHNSFGNSDEHNVIESKRVIDHHNNSLSSDEEQQNFSFFDSDSKARSINRESIMSYKMQQDTTASNKNVAGNRENFMMETNTRKPHAAEHLGKSITSMLVPSYSDGG